MVHKDISEALLLVDHVLVIFNEALDPLQSPPQHCLNDWHTGGMVTTQLDEVVGFAALGCEAAAEMVSGGMADGLPLEVV